MSFFKQVTDAEGNTTFVEVTEDELTETVKAHPAHKQVVDESIKRRQQIKDLKAALEAKDEPEQPKVEPPTVQQPEPQDEDALLDKLYAKLLEKQQADAAAALQRRNALTEVARKHGLGAGVLPVLEQSTNPEATAALLANSSYHFDDTEGGEASTADIIQGAVTGALKKLNLGE